MHVKASEHVLVCLRMASCLWYSVLCCARERSGRVFMFSAAGSSYCIRARPCSWRQAALLLVLAGSSTRKQCAIGASSPFRQCRHLIPDRVCSVLWGVFTAFSRLCGVVLRGGFRAPQLPADLRAAIPAAGCGDTGLKFSGWLPVWRFRDATALSSAGPNLPMPAAVSRSFPVRPSASESSDL